MPVARGLDARRVQPVFFVALMLALIAGHSRGSVWFAWLAAFLLRTGPEKLSPRTQFARVLLLTRLTGARTGFVFGH